MKTKEFYDHKAKEEKYEDFNHWLDCSVYEEQQDKILKWTEQYASQQNDMPSDEEIEKKAEILSERQDGNKKIYIDAGYFDGFIDGAKWVRDSYQNKPIDWDGMRTEWVKEILKMRIEPTNMLYMAEHKIINGTLLNEIQYKLFDWFKSKLK